MIHVSKNSVRESSGDGQRTSQNTFRLQSVAINGGLLRCSKTIDAVDEGRASRSDGNFRLDNCTLRNQTRVAMKTLSRRFRFVVLGVIVTVGVVSCYTFPSITDTIPFFGVDIGYWPLANRKDNAPIYVRWKGEDKFKAALEQVCGHHGEYDLFILRDNHKEDRWTKNCNPNHPRNIRTVKVTKSKAADNIAAG